MGCKDAMDPEKLFAFQKVLVTPVRINNYCSGMRFAATSHGKLVSAWLWQRTFPYANSKSVFIVWPNGGRFVK